MVSPHSVINRNTTYNFLCVTARACDEAFFSFKNVECLFVDFEPVVTMENKQPLTALAYVFLLTSSAECFLPSTSLFAGYFFALGGRSQITPEKRLGPALFSFLLWARIKSPLPSFSFNFISYKRLQL